MQFLINLCYITKCNYFICIFMLSDEEQGSLESIILDTDKVRKKYNIGKNVLFKGFDPSREGLQITLQNTEQKRKIEEIFYPALARLAGMCVEDFRYKSAAMQENFSKAMFGSTLAGKGHRNCNVISSIVEQMVKTHRCDWDIAENILSSYCNYGYFCALNDAIANGSISTEDQAKQILDILDSFVIEKLITIYCLMQIKQENATENNLQLLQIITRKFKQLNYDLIKGFNGETTQLKDFPQYPIQNAQILNYDLLSSHDQSPSNMLLSYNESEVDHGSLENCIHHEEPSADELPSQTAPPSYAASQTAPPSYEQSSQLDSSFANQVIERRNSQPNQANDSPPPYSL